MIKGVMPETVYLYSSRTFKCYAGKVTIVNFGKYDEARFEGVDRDGLRLSTVCSPTVGTVFKNTLWLFEKKNGKRTKNRLQTIMRLSRLNAKIKLLAINSLSMRFTIGCLYDCRVM